MPPTDSETAIKLGAAASRSRRMRAIALMCMTILMFAVLDTTGKYMVTTAQIPVMQVVWLRFGNTANASLRAKLSPHLRTIESALKEGDVLVEVR